MNVWELKSYLAHKKSFDYKIFYTDDIQLKDVIRNSVFVWEETSGIITSLEMPNDISIDGAIKLLWPTDIVPQVVKFDIKDKAGLEVLKSIARTYALEMKQDSSMSYDMLALIPRSFIEKVKENEYLHFETVQALNVTGEEKINISDSFVYELLRSIARMINLNIDISTQGKFNTSQALELDVFEKDNINISDEIHLGYKMDNVAGNIVDIIKDKFCISYSGVVKLGGDLSIKDFETMDVTNSSSLALLGKSDDSIHFNLPVDFGSPQDLYSNDDIFTSKLAVIFGILQTISSTYVLGMDIDLSGSISRYRWARLEDYDSSDLYSSDTTEIQMLNYYEV